MLVIRHSALQANICVTDPLASGSNLGAIKWSRFKPASSDKEC